MQLGKLPDKEVIGKDLCKIGRILVTSCWKETSNAIMLQQPEMLLENQDKKFVTYLYLILSL